MAEKSCSTSQSGFRRDMRVFAAGWMLWLVIFYLSIPRSAAQDTRVHGLWVWKGPSILAAPEAAGKLRNFCKEEQINEVYVSISSHGEMMAESQISRLIGVLHGSGIRVEALISSGDADEPGKHRDKLISHVREIVAFNRKHPKDRFDGIHLDIEPQQSRKIKARGI